MGEQDVGVARRRRAGNVVAAVDGHAFARVCGARRGPAEGAVCTECLPQESRQYGSPSILVDLPSTVWKSTSGAFFCCQLNSTDGAPSWRRANHTSTRTPSAGAPRPDAGGPAACSRAPAHDGFGSGEERRLVPSSISTTSRACFIVSVSDRATSSPGGHPQRQRPRRRPPAPWPPHPRRPPPPPRPARLRRGRRRRARRGRRGGCDPPRAPCACAGAGACRRGACVRAVRLAPVGRRVHGGARRGGASAPNADPSAGRRPPRRRRGLGGAAAAAAAAAGVAWLPGGDAGRGRTGAPAVPTWGAAARGAAGAGGGAARAAAPAAPPPAARPRGVRRAGPPRRRGAAARRFATGGGPPPPGRAGGRRVPLGGGPPANDGTHSVAN